MSPSDGNAVPTGDVPDHDEGRREGAFAGRKRAATETVGRWREVGVERAEDIERRFWPAVVLHLFYDRFRAVNGVVLAGHLAFRAFSFLLPLAFGFVALASVLHASGRDPAETTEHLKLGEAIAQSMRSAGGETGDAPVRVALGAFLTLVLGSLGLLSGLHFVYAQAWQMSVRKIEKRAGKVVRFILAFILTFAILMLASSLRRSNAVLEVASVLGTGAVIAVLFVGLALIMPHRSEGVVWLVPGGLVGAIGVVGLQVFATFYLPGKLDSFSATYGALGVAAVVISYLYLIGLMVVASALASAVWFDYCTGAQAVSVASPPPPSGAVGNEPR
jgi:uncharacterized BrkB/YihY/UPF0761 family membrane protein